MKNLTIRGYLPAAVYLCAHLLSPTAANAEQTFTTVINVPTDPAPAYIGSDTQLNLFDGGSLPYGFSLGDQLYGPNTHIEVNINGGTVGNDVNIGIPDQLMLSSNADVVMNVYGGSIGRGMTVNADSTLNFHGGTIGPYLEVESGGTVNLFSGSLGDNIAPKNGSTFNISGGSIGSLFAPENNTIVNISGGKIGDHFSLGCNTTVNISGGVVPEIEYVGSGGILKLSGGTIGPLIGNQTDITITGSEFRFNGVPVAGLNSPGDSISFPTNTGGYLTSTFSDGAVFVYNPSYLDGTLTLTLTDMPAKPPVINSPSDPAPLGLRPDQTLNLATGATLTDFFTAAEATLNITGGTVGDHMRAVGASVNLSKGSIGDDFEAVSNSLLMVAGGHIGTGLRLLKSNAIITGGILERFTAGANSTVDISGGTIGPFHAKAKSTITLTGSAFKLDGADLTLSLQPGVPFLLTGRNAILDGTLADGSPFSIDLNATNSFASSFFDTDADLTLTLVPEPTTLLAGILTGSVMMASRRRGPTCTI